MWLAILSDQLPVVALVVRYTANELIGREPLPQRIAFAAASLREPMRAPERTRYYPAVGPAIPLWGAGRSRVTHPSAGCGELPPRPRDLHVLSTPPAFVLSQDQTLQ
jgi:hypothetical protein